MHEWFEKGKIMKFKVDETNALRMNDRFSERVRILNGEESFVTLEFWCEIKDDKGNDIASQQQLDKYITDFVSATQKLSDSDASNCLKSVKFDQTLTKKYVDIRVRSLDLALQVWKRDVEPVVKFMQTLGARDLIDRSDKFKESARLTNALFNKLMVMINIAGFGKIPFPRWSTELADAEKANLMLMKKLSEDEHSKSMFDLGYTTKADLVFVAKALYEFCHSNGKSYKFFNYVGSAIDQKAFAQVYRDLEKATGNTDTDDIEYGISHYGALYLLNNKLSYCAERYIQSYVSEPSYLLRDCSEASRFLSKSNK